MDQNSQPVLSETSADLVMTILTEEESSAASNTEDKTFMERAFGPLHPGSMRGSIFTLLASAMGTGVFNLPYRINEIGILAYALFVTVGGLYSYLGMYFISTLILKFKASSYSTMSEMAQGRWLRRVAEFCLIIYPWGSTICFQVIFAKFIIQLLVDTFNLPLYDGDIGRQTETYSNQGNLVCMGITAAAILLNLVFILKKQIGVLQRIAIIGVLSVIFNVLIIVFTFLFGFTVQLQDKEGIRTEYVYHGVAGIQWDQLHWFNTHGVDAFFAQMQGVASLIFCFVSHQLVFPLVYALDNPCRRRVTKMFNRVHITEIISYILVGLTGYLLLAEHVDARPINAMVMASIQTTLMSIGKCFMVVYMFFAVPLNLFPAREVFYETFGIQKTDRNRILTSLGLAFSGAIIAVAFQKINSYFGVLGGTAGVMMTGLIPTICYATMVGLKTLKQKLMAVFMVLVSLLGIIGAFLSVILN